MAYVEAEDNDPKPGTRVCVQRADGTQDLRLGTFCGRLNISDVVEEAGPEWEDITTPEIELDDGGGKIYGFMCIWVPVPERTMLN